MVGKVGAAHKEKRYRNYYCSRAMHSRGFCSFYNGHSAPKLEKAILEYLGQFSDPDKVREYLTTVEYRELERYEAELGDVKKRLADLEDQFLRRLDDLLKRGVLTEQEFARANETAREQTKMLSNRKEELQTWLEQEHARVSLVEQVPRVVKAFIEAFQATDVRQQKAQLQTILKAARVYRDGRIELEFRGSD